MVKKVLFLCTGNSCRSQLAEAIVNTRLRETWQAFSAGTDPAGSVHPIALQVLSEFGIMHDGRSKHIDEIKEMDFNLIITVCDNAEKNCPVWLGDGKRHHIGFPDPAEVAGTDFENLAAFRDVRDAIADQIVRLLSNYDQEEHSLRRD